VAAISPFRRARDEARALIGDFVEVHVAPPLEECIRRDVKGLYAKAMAGEIRAFTGIGDPYEEPVSPELRIDTSLVSVARSTARILAKLSELGYLLGK
jgi:adenylylsulfate kinase